MSLPQSLTLLPATSTPLEQALAATTARISAIPTPLDVLWDPWRCPAPLLPWLAWALSVDIWDDAWPIEKKRYVCAESFNLHWLKGTLEGIRRHVALVDAKVLRAITPPSKLFMGRTRTASERRAFLERYPQLRVYAFRGQGEAGKAAFCTGSWGLAKSFFADASGQPVFFPVASDAPARFGKRGILYEPRDGSERPLAFVTRETLTEERLAETHGELRIPGHRAHGVFAGAAPRARTFFGGDKAGRIVTIKTVRSYQDRDERLTLRTVSPGLTPIEVDPEQVAVRGTAGAVRFFGLPLGGHLVKSSAPERLYDRLYLFDPERAIAKTGAQQFIAGRFGMPAYHAEIEISVPGRRSKWHFDRFMCGHSKPADTERLEKARRAVRVSKSRRDKIMIDTTTRRPKRFGDGVLFGDNHTFGSLVRG